MPAIYNAYTDEDLVSLMSQDNEDAFTEIYNRYWKKVLYVAASKLGDMTLAEDVVQDVLGDLWRRRSEIGLQGKLEAYLAVAVKYKVINALATRKRERSFRDHAALEGVESDLSTQYWLDFKDLKEQLALLVDTLPERCMLSYTLRREEGLSQRETAHFMNISEKAVEQNMSRALHTLRLGLKYFFSTFF